MNEYMKKFFLDEISKNKGSDSEVMKDEVVAFCLDHGLAVKKTTAKASLIDLIQEHGLFDDFYGAFSYRFTLPIWRVAEYFDLYQSQLEALIKYKVITTESYEQSYKGRRGKFTALAFPLEICEAYTASQLKGAYDEIFHDGEFKIRIETKTKADFEPILEKLSTLFTVQKEPVSYEHREHNGFYHYVSLRDVPDTKLNKQANTIAHDLAKREHASLLNQITELQEKLKELRKLQRQLIAENERLARLQK